jgi:hypothetical protein
MISCIIYTYFILLPITLSIANYITTFHIHDAIIFTIAYNILIVLCNTTQQKHIVFITMLYGINNLIHHENVHTILFYNVLIRLLSLVTLFYTIPQRIMEYTIITMYIIYIQLITEIPVIFTQLFLLMITYDNASDIFTILTLDNVTIILPSYILWIVCFLPFTYHKIIYVLYWNYIISLTIYNYFSTKKE